MFNDFKRELLERHSTLDLEADFALFEGLTEKYGLTLQKQGPQATAEVAAMDVEKYLDSKAVFLRELSSYGLDMDNTTDHGLALELWDERSYPIIVDDQDVYHAAQVVQREVERYLLGKQQSASPVANAPVLASRFSQENLESLVRSDQKQRDFVLALSEFLSKALQLDRGVMEFRRDVLGDSKNTISREEADDLVRSPAAQRLSLDSFNEAGIPVVGHTANLVPREDGSHLLYVESLGKTVTFDSVEPQRQFFFQWFTREGRPQRPLVDEFSILGRLGKLSEALTEHPPISVEDAAYLTLCGGTIQPRSISGRIVNNNFVQAGAHTYNYSTITLTAASWMSPEQVRQAYSNLRRRATAKNTYRSKSDKNIAVFRFVVERGTMHVPKDLVIGTSGKFMFPPWRQLVGEWNKQYPTGHRQRFDQPGHTAEKMFRNAFVAGYRTVTGLTYYAPKPITSKEQVDNIMRKLKSRTQTHGNR
jgi:hypothetical protein